MRIITGNDFDAPTDLMYKSTKALKLNDFIFVKMGSFLWDFETNSLPSCFRNYFTNTNVSHRYSRFCSNMKVRTDFPIRTQTHGVNSFRYKGAKILNSLKDNLLYSSSKAKFHFTKKMKYQILNSY